MLYRGNKSGKDTLGSFIIGNSGDAGIEVTPPPTDILFGSSAVTNADGTRSVVSEGTDTTAKLDLYSGQGLRFDGTQYIDTGFTPDLGKDFTLLFTAKRQAVGNRQNGSFYDTNNRFHFGFNTDGFRVGIGNKTALLGDPLSGFVNLYIRYEAELRIVRFGIIGGGMSQYVIQDSNDMLPLFIGALNNNLAVSVIGIQKDFYYIPFMFSPANLLEYSENPEKLLYYSNGNLMSDMLSQSVLDDLKAGGGFWYPLCENNISGNSVTEMVSGEQKTIVNYANSPMRDNATKLPYGLQTSLIKQDSFGLPIGVVNDGELVWVDGSYATPDTPLVLTGNFCVDTYVKGVGTVDSTFLNFATDTADPILIGVVGATGNVDIALLTEYTSTQISTNGAVVSLERDGGTLKAFVNNIEVSRISYSGTVTLDIVGALSATSNFAIGESGSLGFTKTTRTYGQRLATYNALRAKHGVY